MNPDNTIATAPHTSVWICGTGPAQQPQQQQNTAATICTQYGCQPPAGGATPPHFNTAFTTCTQPVVCQPQQNANVSVPPHCPTVAPMCPPPANGGGQAQAQFPTWPPLQCTVGVTTGILTAVVGCAPQQGQAQQSGAQAQGFPPSIVGCQPTQSVASCTTIAGYTHNPPMCPPPPANMGGQAQAQFPTWPPAQCTGVLTAVFGCAQQGQQAQAQGVYPTLTCPAPQPQGQNQALPHTLFPPLCNVGGGQTGAYTHFPGCTTVTSNPMTPSTHFPGCTGVTATPATVGNTHLFGCTTITSTPPTYSAGCTPATVGYTHLMGCTTVTSTPTTQAQGQGPVQVPNHGGQTGALPPTYHPAGGCGPAANANGGQAQAQIPTIPVLSCGTAVATAAGFCTGIVFVC